MKDCVSALRKYDGHFVKCDPEAISSALDDNRAYIVCGKVMIKLEAVERSGEVVKQEFVLYVDKREVLRSTDEDKVIKLFMETL